MNTPRVAVIGSRSGIQPSQVDAIVRKIADKYPGATIVSGRARGVDALAEQAANYYGLAFDPYEADWATGKLAGKVRNWRLAGADLTELVAVWDGWSNGTAHAVTAATRLGVRSWVYSPSPADLGVAA